MTAYIPITDAETDPGAPGTSELWKKWRDNPLAIAEGSTGAPLIKSGWYPYDMVNIGDGADGVIYDFSVNGSVASVTSPALPLGWDYAIVVTGLKNGGFVTELKMSLNGGSSTTIFTSPATNTTACFTIASGSLPITNKKVDCLAYASGTPANSYVPCGGDARVSTITLAYQSVTFSGGTVAIYKRGGWV